MKRHGNRANGCTPIIQQAQQATILFDGGPARGVSNEDDQNFLPRRQDDHQIEGSTQPIHDG